MALNKVTGSSRFTGLYSKDNNFDVGQLREDLVIGDTENSKTLTVKEDGSIIATGTVTLSSLILAEKTPATAAATGTKGEIAWDADFIYVCIDTDTWVRAAIATWGE
jgi:hypothetical protein